MKKKITFIAKGLVWGHCWGGGQCGYKSKRITADTKEELDAKINEGISDGSLDGGMGYESLMGAVMDITTKTTIEVEGKEYTNTEIETETFGTLSESVENDLVENLMFN